MSTPHELTWIETEEGYLAASFHPAAEARPSPAVLMCHGFTGHRGEAHFLFVHAARAFARAGVAALRVDFRGSGESEGEFRDMTVGGEITDALAALDYLAHRPEVDAERVAVLGLSLGGAVAACVAGREPSVAALVLWSAVADLQMIAARFLQPGSEPLRLPDGSYELGGLALGQSFVDTILHHRPTDEVQRFGGPVLIVHGTEDQSVPLSHAELYAKVLGKQAEVHLIEGADHVFARVPWKAEAIEVSAGFLGRTLRAQS